MNVRELLETVSDTPASKEDLEFSVAKIKEVKSELDDLLKQDKYNPDSATHIKMADKRKAAQWKNVVQEAQWRMDFAIRLHEKIIPEFNKIKAAANKAAKDKDVDTLEKCHQQLKAFVIDNDLIKIDKRISHRDTFRFKIERGYPKKICDAIQWILSVRDYIPKLILRASRTDQENAKADKASAAMKSRWGSTF